MNQRKKVCFISRRNTCRSIIAEVYLRHYGKQFFEVQSFGLKPDRVNHLVKDVLSRRGINSNYSFSKAYEVIENQKFDVLVLLNPDLKGKLPGNLFIPELVTWDYPEIIFEEEDDKQITGEIEKLCDKIEKDVQAFIEKYK